MNINVILGSIAFTVWSVISVWLYVNFIKDFQTVDDTPTVVKIETPAVELPVAKSERTPLAEEEAVVEEIPETMELSKNFVFDLNSAVVMDKAGLKAFIDEVKSSVNGRKVSIKITGHTCDRGSDKYNENLGLKRAKSVENILSNAGFDNIDVESDGESSPLVPNDSEENRSKNRRVAISITTIS